MSRINILTPFNAIRHFSLAGFLILLITACSNDKPPVALARDNLEKAIESQGQGRIKLVGFTYLKDKEVNYGGGDSKGYAVLWKAYLEFLQDSYWPVDPELLKTAPANQPPSPVGESKLRKKGDQIAIKGRYNFDKDNGVWTIIGSEYLHKKP